ncbi:hypothetical protein [Nocardia vaccinii]|uniref:hypothetical protein n=1 Tax=Nocardia vaccinii TaxID=1822 RepID=UPI000833D28E|nr:hypothetical protein [Nocardia vaccinii]
MTRSNSPSSRNTPRDWPGHDPIAATDGFTEPGSSADDLCADFGRFIFLLGGDDGEHHLQP